ncbi:MAG: hypothetical protein ACYS7Y_29905 [Planctomycetota bacterium]|jgi:hypothetical protein
MSVEYCHACDSHVDTDVVTDHEVECSARATIGYCDRCKLVSQYEQECQLDGGEFHPVPMCVLELVDGKLRCADCGAEYEPVPDGMRLLKPCLT